MMRQFFNVFTVIVLASLLHACAEPNKESDAVTSVKTIKATCSGEESLSEFPFISKPYRVSELSFRVGGLVDQMDIQPGQFFKQGQLIASVDPRDFRVKYHKAKAIYSQSEAEFKRVEALYKLDNIAASIYEKAKAEYETALSLFHSAENDLNDTKLYAPFDGFVQEVLFECFQDAKAGQSICSFIDIDRIKIEVFVPQQVAMKVKPGQVVEVRFDAEPNQTYAAAVEQVSKGASRNNLSFRLTIVLHNESKALLSGMSGRVAIPNLNHSETIMIPQRVVRNSSMHGTYVWGIKGNKAVVIPVVVGKVLNNGMIHIVSGLGKDEVVVASSLEVLNDSMRVNVTN